MLRPSAVLIVWFAALSLGAAAAAGQEPPPPIGPFVVDIRGSVPQFTSNLQLAQSRGLSDVELPGAGLGLDGDAQLYFFKWKAVTFGAGALLTLGRSHHSATAAGGTRTRAVTEKFASFAPQISFNFGTGDGWSYISGGIGASQWSIVPDGETPLPADVERLKTINYGGGARWFITPHIAFHFDVRFYAIDPGTPEFGFPGSPRTTLLILGAGVAIR